MKLIGGEKELRDDGLFLYITDSGRSSLRLILQSFIKNKKILLPDFLCQVVLYVFNELNIEYSFYSINEDLSINTENIKNKEFDVLYLINYFGQVHKIDDDILKDNILVIEDSVFLPTLEKPKNINNWIGYNSFRKMSYVANGSIIKSTVELNDKLILKREADFPALKYKAKHMKYKYLNEDEYSEEDFLPLIDNAIDILDHQKNIYSISTRSLFNLFEFHKNLKKEYSIRKKNYDILNHYLNKLNIDINTEYFSYYILAVERRDDLKEYLFSKMILLPIHWPNVNGLKNNLYDKIISIPVDS